MIGRSRSRKLVPAILFVFALSLKFSVMAPIDLDASASLRHLPSQTMKRLIVDRAQGLSLSTLPSRPSAASGFWLWNDPESVMPMATGGYAFADIKSSRVSSFTRPLYLVLKMLVI